MPFPRISESKCKYVLRQMYEILILLLKDKISLCSASTGCLLWVSVCSCFYIKIICELIGRRVKLETMWSSCRLISILMAFRFYVIMRISDRKNVNGFLLRFSGYQRIQCMFATSLFIIWQIVSTSNVGHRQAFVQIKKSELSVTGNIDAHSSVTQTGTLHIKNKHLPLMFLHVPTSAKPSSGRYKYIQWHTNTSRFCQRCSHLWQNLLVCLSISIHDDDLVEEGTCSKNIRDKCLFITDGAVFLSNTVQDSGIF
jgi:hypothetical protein